MSDQLKSGPRRRVVYVRDDELALWEDADALGAVLGMPVSAMVNEALREWKPLVAFRAPRDAAVG